MVPKPRQLQPRPRDASAPRADALVHEAAGLGLETDAVLLRGLPHAAAGVQVAPRDLRVHVHRHALRPAGRVVAEGLAQVPRRRGAP